MQIPKRSARRMTNECSVWRNNIPMHVVLSSVMQFQADDISTYSIKAGKSFLEIEKMLQTLERRQLHLIAALFRQCREMKLISEVSGDRPL